MLGKRRRRLILILASLVIGLTVLWLSMPLWFPWILRPLARLAGAGYDRSERDGYRHLIIYGARFNPKGIRIRAQRVEVVEPNVWLWRSLLGNTNQSRSFVVIENWDLETVPATAQPIKKTGVQPASSDLLSQIQSVGKWLPTAVLSNGTVRTSGAILEIPKLVWSQGSFSADVRYPKAAAEANVQARALGPAGYEVEVSSEALHLTSAIRVFTNVAGLAIQSTNLWWSNRVELNAQLRLGGSLPETASLLIPELRLPSSALGLPYYGDLAGSLSAQWHAGRFGLDANIQAQPLSAATNFPPLNLSLHARGDLASATIETATLVSPWIRAELSRELEVQFSGQLLPRPALLKVEADLARQPWLKARGTLAGEAEFTPSVGRLPDCQFRLSGSEVGYESFQSRLIKLEGTLDWPHLELTQAEASLDDGSRVSIKGKVDLASRDVRDGSLLLKGPVLKRWLPTGYSYGELELSGGFGGPLDALAHQGHLAASQVTSPLFRPLQIQVDWTGVNTRLEKAEIVADTGSASLALQAAFQQAANQIQIDLSALTIRTNQQKALSLSRPCRVELSARKGDVKWALNVSPLTWEGIAGRGQVEAAIAWPRQGEFNVHLQGIGSSIAAGFVKTNLPAARIVRLDAVGGWTNSPLQFDLGLQASASGFDLRSSAEGLELQLQATASQNRLLISNLLVKSDTSSVVTVRGSLPLAITPGEGTNLVRLDPEQPLALSTVARPESAFWNQLADMSGLALREPQFQLEVSGTWKAPVGRASLRAQGIKFREAGQRKTNSLPELTHLEFDLELNREEARLILGRLLIQGQPLEVSGELPLGETFWSRLKDKQLPDWNLASGRLQSFDAEVSAFQPLIPNILVPQGQLNLDLELSPGLKLNGEFDLDHARTRPLGSMGPVRDIGLHATLRDRQIELRDATARIGGATVSLSGQADLRGTNWFKEKLPPFSLGLRGASIPLVREPEVVVRSDLLLALTKTNGAPPLISGAAHLRDGFYLSDLQDLIPGGVATPSRRPPYFSVDEPFLADWRLAVDVDGQKFLKVRSSLFNGEVSANLKIQGTLKDPIALGDIKTDSGFVRFPFVSLDVQRGFVSLSSQDPFHPQLSVLAASKQYGYDIRMEVTGPVDSPVIQFSSTPPLNSEQILLMATAGELPHGGYTLSTQQRAQNVALFVGRDLLSKLGIGDQSEQKLTFISGQEITEQGRPTYQVEYKLTDRWSLTGEYDRFGAYNAGFKWRVYSK